MSGSLEPDVARVMAVIARGEAEILDGRGVNTSYRVVDGGRPYSVKAHHPAASSELVARRIRLVDKAVRGLAWYPPVLAVGRYGSRRPALVVIRPFIDGNPAQDAGNHLRELAGVLGDLAARGANVRVAEELITDYASAWLADGAGERTRADRILAGDFPPLARWLDEHLANLLTSAARLTSANHVVVHHGDLHGRNLIVGPSGRCTVIDWDESGFSRRPADTAKALWLSCRRGRGDFELSPSAVRRFLCRVPGTDAGDLARLGALWFLPTHRHVMLLGQRDAALVPWYLGWVSRFWNRLRTNLDVIAEAERAVQVP